MVDQMNMLIGLSGKMGTGKNYIAEKVLPLVLSKFIHNAQYYYMAFGDQIKVELGCRRPELTYDMLFEKKTRDVRQLLQQYGTENGRGVYGENIWINSLNMWMEIHKSRTSNTNNIFVVTDVRFKNEADWIEANNGILLRINAPSRNHERIQQEESHEIQNHISETDLDNYKFKYIVTNDKDDDPHKQITNIMCSIYQRKTN